MTEGERKQRKQMEYMEKKKDRMEEQIDEQIDGQ